MTIEISVKIFLVLVREQQKRTLLHNIDPGYVFFLHGKIEFSSFFHQISKKGFAQTESP